MSGRGAEPRGAPLGPSVAGTWYPAGTDALRRQVDQFLAEPGSADPGAGALDVAALIEPHAGYRYSGAVAARGFRELRGRRVARVILIGPSHHAAFAGAAVPRAGAYRTPLGEVPIDTAATADLAALPGFRREDTPFRPEHCLEAEIPFLQRCLAPGWRLLPLLIGAGAGSGTAGAVADSLRPLIGGDTLVVVSSDFTHHGPRFGFVPFTDELPRRIEELDMGAVERILERDADGFASYVRRTGATICGHRAIDVLLRLLPAEVEGHLGAYDTSGRMTGDWDHSVSYASIVFGRPHAGRSS